jgi:hypothetical protein
MLYISSTFLLGKRSTGAHAGPLYRPAIFVSGLVLFIAVTAVRRKSSGILGSTDSVQ